MQKYGAEPRKKVSIFVDDEFRDFLEQLKEEENLSISLILERATIEKFQKEYDEFKAISRT